MMSMMLLPSASLARQELEATQTQLASVQSELAAERAAAVEVRAALKRCELELASEKAKVASPSTASQSQSNSTMIAELHSPAMSCRQPSLAQADIDTGVPKLRLESDDLWGVVAACEQQTLRLRKFGVDAEASCNEAIAALDSLEDTVSPSRDSVPRYGLTIS